MTTATVAGVVAGAISTAAPAPAAAFDLVQLGEIAAAIVAISGLVALIYKLMTRDLSREIGLAKHSIGNVRGRVDALEHARTADVERIVRVEVNYANLERTLDRVEKKIDDRFDDVVTSIREIRSVAPRG